METSDQSANSSSTAQPRPVLQSFPAQTVAAPISFYTASSSAMYRQPSSGSLDDDEMAGLQQQGLGSSAVRNA